MYDEQTTMNPATKMRQRLRKCVLLALVLPGVSPISRAQSPKPLLLRDPAVSKSQVAFSYAGSIWVVNRDGGNVRRLTGGGHEDRKSTRLNSSHGYISYAVFCLKKKTSVIGFQTVALSAIIH